MRSTNEVMIRAYDLDAAKQFYHERLGFPVVVDTPKVVGFDTGSFNLYVERGVDPTPVFEFDHDGLEKTKARLVAAGCTVVEENPAIPRCYLRDPFGMIFNLSQD
jgi:catechol 2,3-dioxygenase-like lactoylglutathione lyase family enzyme